MKIAIILYLLKGKIMNKDNKTCIFCKKTLTVNHLAPICKSCRKRSKDWMLGILGTVGLVFLADKKISKDR